MSSSCGQCGQELPLKKRLQCSRCKLVCYCNADCQKLHWKNHKSVCKSFTIASKHPHPPSNPTPVTATDPISNQAFTEEPHSSSQTFGDKYRRPAISVSDIPAPLSFSYRASPSGIDSNLLILFHGLGDNGVPYAKFARTLNLPQTCILTLNGPIRLSSELTGIEDSHSWYEYFESDGEFITPTAIELRRVRSLEHTRGLLWAMMDRLLEIGWHPKRIFLMGFSMGAHVATDLAMHYKIHQEPHLGFGGVICISSSCMPEYVAGGHDALIGSLRQSPLLVTHGEKDSRVPLKQAKSEFEFLVEHDARRRDPQDSSNVKDPSGALIGPAPERSWKQFQNKGHFMISSHEEAKEVLSFFSRYLYLRNVALENQADVIEIKPE